MMLKFFSKEPRALGLTLEGRAEAAAAVAFASLLLLLRAAVCSHLGFSFVVALRASRKVAAGMGERSKRQATSDE